MRKNIIGIIGGGNMGEALVKGLYAKHCVHVCESNVPRVKYLRNKYKGIVVGDFPDLFDDLQFIFWTFILKNVFKIIEGFKV